MLNHDKPKRGRKFGVYPQQLLRVACEKQELQGIHEVVPDTRLRAVTLLAQPTLIETQERIVKLAKQISQAALVVQAEDTLARQILAQIAVTANDIAELADLTGLVLKGEKQ